MKVLRTPDSRFDNLPGYDFAPHYLQIDNGASATLRMHYLDEGLATGIPILLMHGEPSWCYLYRKMIPNLVAAGFRVLAPDLIGFGRSDKPSEKSDYSYQSHVDWMQMWLDAMELKNIVLFCQDWGGLIGLRLVAENEDHFSGVVAANTFLPTGDRAPSEAFLKWQSYSQSVPEFPVGGIIDGATVTKLTPDIVAAYDAPFPDESYKAGARQFPLLVPTTPNDPAAQPNRAAWQVLAAWKKPFLTAFSDQDPVSAGGDIAFQKMIPGAAGQNHVTIVGGGHFLQEDKGEQLADLMVKFVSDNQLVTQ